MIFNVTLPVGVRLKMLQKESKFVMMKKGDVHYIGGTEVLPPPLNVDEENRRILQLGTEEEHRAKTILIEHNLRLVVFGRTGSDVAGNEAGNVASWCFGANVSNVSASTSERCQ